MDRLLSAILRLLILSQTFGKACRFTVSRLRCAAKPILHFAASSRLLRLDRDGCCVVGVIRIPGVCHSRRVLNSAGLHDIYIGNHRELACTCQVRNAARDRSSESSWRRACTCANRGGIQGDRIEPQAAQHGVLETNVRSLNILGILDLPRVSIRRAHWAESQLPLGLRSGPIR